MAKVKREAQKEIKKYYLTILGEEREVTKKEYFYFHYRFGSTNTDLEFSSEYVSGKIEKESLGFTPYTITVESEEEHTFLWGLFKGGKGMKKESCWGFTSEYDWKFLSLIAEMDK